MGTVTELQVSSLGQGHNSRISVGDRDTTAGEQLGTGHNSRIAVGDRDTTA